MRHVIDGSRTSGHFPNSTKFLRVPSYKDDSFSRTRALGPIPPVPALQTILRWPLLSPAPEGNQKTPPHLDCGAQVLDPRRFRIAAVQMAWPLGYYFPMFSWVRRLPARHVRIKSPRPQWPKEQKIGPYQLVRSYTTRDTSSSVSQSFERETLKEALPKLHRNASMNAWNHIEGSSAPLYIWGTYSLVASSRLAATYRNVLYTARTTPQAMTI